MTVIRSRFEIVIILRKELSDVRSFVDQVYAIDSYPIDIIQEKTEYLLQEMNEVVFVLVKNNNVDMWDVDMGEYAKKECRYVAATKVIIREKWNKIPHHHVIHGTDNEVETRHILSLFGEEPIEYYLTNQGTPFPFHIAPFEYEEIELDITLLNGRLLEDMWGKSIEETPHYLYAIDNKEPYIKYHEKHYGIGLIEDHFPERFDDMIKYFNNGGKFPPILVIGDRIIDGGHRCAIYLSKGITKVKALSKKINGRKRIVKHKILLVGGTGGIGQQLLDAFDKEKYEVVAIGSKDIDITNQYSDWNKLSGVGVVVNLAGVIAPVSLSEHSGMSQRMVEVNCLGAVNLLMGLLPIMKPHRYGRIIMMSSVFSEITVPGYGVYSATKAFVDKLVKSAAIENAKHGITINSIQLGYTGLGMGALEDEKLYEKTKNKCELKRFCSPTDIAKTIDYIIETEYLTGQNIRLDGGIR